MSPAARDDSSSLRRVLVVHVPNLNLRVTLEPDICGTQTVDDHVQALRTECGDSTVVESFISNSEAECVGAVQGAKEQYDAIVINAGAFTHYSWALHDAVRSFPGVVVEVHLSNPGAREEFRHVSVLSSVVDGTVSGFGSLGYALAGHAVTSLLSR